MDDSTTRYDAVLVSGRAVKAHRARRDLTQQTLAQAIGRSRGWVSVIESRDTVSVSRETAQRLAQALQAELASLLEEGPQGDAEPDAGDFTFGSPTPVSRDPLSEDEELDAILADLKRLERRLTRLLARRERRSR